MRRERNNPSFLAIGARKLHIWSTHMSAVEIKRRYGEQTGRLKKGRQRLEIHYQRDMRTCCHGFVGGSNLQHIKVCSAMVAFWTRGCRGSTTYSRTVSNLIGEAYGPAVESACFHMSSPPRTSSTCFLWRRVLDVIWCKS